MKKTIVAMMVSASLAFAVAAQAKEHEEQKELAASGVSISNTGLLGGKTL